MHTTTAMLREINAGHGAIGNSSQNDARIVIRLLHQPRDADLMERRCTVFMAYSPNQMSLLLYRFLSLVHVRPAKEDEHTLINDNHSTVAVVRLREAYIVSILFIVMCLDVTDLRP